MQQWSGGVKTTQHFYALDLPGSTVRGLFHAPGGVITVSQRYSYGPFGEPQTASGSTGNPLRFAARELDATTGLYYVRARWYDPSMGRFVSEDPIGLAGGINTYAYAANDPVNLSDPTGLCYRGAEVYIANDSGEPCKRGLLNWSFLVDRWSGIRNGDGIASSMSGVTFAMSAGWQDAVAEKKPGAEEMIAAAAVQAGSCVAEVLGVEDLLDGGLIAAGQPLPGTKRFRTPGSSRGTSVAGMVSDRVFGDRQFSRRWPSIVGGPGTGRRLAIAGTKSMARWAGRAVPVVGWAFLVADGVQFGACLLRD